MATRRAIRKPTQPDQADYPTLREHLSTRRRFLGVVGASAAASGLAAACNRAMGAGTGQDAGTSPDATPDATPPSPGGDPGPDYFTLRVPTTDDLYAYLIDGGSARFYVEVVTYVEVSYLALQENLETAGNRARAVIEEYTYDALSTAQGVTAAEDDVHAALDELVMELENHQDPTLEAVTLTLTYLDPEPIMMGEAPSPSYP